MLVARKGSGVTLTSAVLLSGALLLSACEENDLVEPTAHGSPAAPAQAAPDALLAEGTQRNAAASNIYSDRVGEPTIDVPDEGFVEIMSIPDLPAGQYIVTGHIGATNRDREAYTYLACFLRVDGTNRGATVTFFEENRGGGVSHAKSIPVAGHVDVESGSARLSVECQRQGQRGFPVIGGGGGGRTQLIAARVG